MALSIPTQIEQDFQSGKARYKTFQTGFGPQSVLGIQPNSYIVIFGYVFNPAGGSFQHRAVNTPLPVVNDPTPLPIRQFGTQQILIYTGNDFFPFMHHVDIKSSICVNQFNVANGDTLSTLTTYEVDNSPQTYSTYITANKPVSIAHGLVNNAAIGVAGSIPVSPETPAVLTYGGYGALVPVQTNLGGGAFENQFLQPYFNFWSRSPYAYGLIPANASEQAWLKPGATGMTPASEALVTLGINTQISSNYIITLHYALYTETNN
jgi:hypothetical protein